MCRVVQLRNLGSQNCILRFATFSTLYNSTYSTDLHQLGPADMLLWENCVGSTALKGISLGKRTVIYIPGESCMPGSKKCPTSHRLSLSLSLQTSSSSCKNIMIHYQQRRGITTAQCIWGQAQGGQLGPTTFRARLGETGRSPGKTDWNRLGLDEDAGAEVRPMVKWFSLSACGIKDTVLSVDIFPPLFDFVSKDGCYSTLQPSSWQTVSFRVMVVLSDSFLFMYHLLIIISFPIPYPCVHSRTDLVIIYTRIRHVPGGQGVRRGAEGSAPSRVLGRK